MSEIQDLPGAVLSLDDKRQDVVGSTTVIKALRVLRLAAADAEVSASSVARAFGIDKSTGSRLIRTLAGEGFLSPQPDGRNYVLGPAVIELAATMQSGSNIRGLAMDVLTNLRNVTGETVSIQTRVGDSRVCIAQVPSERPVRWVIEIGEARPLTAGSSAKVLLAAMTDQDLLRVVNSSLRQKFTTRTLDRDALLADVQAVRRSGYAINEGERIDGVSGIAVPIVAPAGSSPLALAVSGPNTRWIPERMLEHLAVIQKSAAEISARLGGSAWTAPQKSRTKGSAR